LWGEPTASMRANVFCWRAACFRRGGNPPAPAFPGGETGKGRSDSLRRRLFVPAAARFPAETFHSREDFWFQFARKCQEFCVNGVSETSRPVLVPAGAARRSFYQRQNGAERARARPLSARRQRTLAGEHRFAIHKAHGRLRWVRGPSFLLVGFERFFFVFSGSRFSSFLIPASAPATISETGSTPRASSARNSIFSSDSAAPATVAAAPLPRSGTTHASW